jgi:Domain of unknown function (DUF6378)
MNILQEADKITSVDRHKDYGNPRPDFERTAKLWSAYLDMNIQAEDIPMLMILLKVSRQKHKDKADNLVDIAGYARTREMLNEAAPSKQNPNKNVSPHSRRPARET